MGWWLGCEVQRSNRSSRQHNHVGVSTVSCLVASSDPRVEVAGYQERHYAAETGGPLRSVGGKVKVKPQGFLPVCRPI